MIEFFFLTRKAGGGTLSLPKCRGQEAGEIMPSAITVPMLALGCTNAREQRFKSIAPKSPIWWTGTRWG
jgi:hypothetical protein